MSSDPRDNPGVGDDDDGGGFNEPLRVEGQGDFGRPVPRPTAGPGDDLDLPDVGALEDLDRRLGETADDAENRILAELGQRISGIDATEGECFDAIFAAMSGIVAAIEADSSAGDTTLNQRAREAADELNRVIAATGCEDRAHVPFDPTGTGAPWEILRDDSTPTPDTLSDAHRACLEISAALDDAAENGPGDVYDKLVAAAEVIGCERHVADWSIPPYRGPQPSPAVGDTLLPPGVIASPGFGSGGAGPADSPVTAPVADPADTPLSAGIGLTTPAGGPGSPLRQPSQRPATSGDTCPLCSTAHIVNVTCPAGSVTLDMDHSQRQHVSVIPGSILTSDQPTQGLTGFDIEVSGHGYLTWHDPVNRVCYTQEASLPSAGPLHVAIGRGATPQESRDSAGDVCKCPTGPADELTSNGKPQRKPFIKRDRGGGDQDCSIDRWNRPVSDTMQIVTADDGSAEIQDDNAGVQYVTAGGAFKSGATTVFTGGVGGPGALLASASVAGAARLYKSHLAGAAAESIAGSADVHEIFKAAMEVVRNLAEDAIEAGGCVSPATIGPATARIITSLAATWIGPLGQDADIPLAYAQHNACPQRYPTSADAALAYLADTVERGTAESWARINNDCPEPWWKIVEAQRSKLGPRELVDLYRRGLLDTQEYADGIRSLAFLEGDKPDQFIELNRFVPGPNDLIRFMVRDVEDDDIVKRFDLDDDFDKKWRGYVKQRGDWQGVGQDDALRFWRAHWRLPGPHQLYEMLHRLRPGRPGAGPVVTEDDVRTALKQDDVLPWWIDRLIAVSYKPLTRVDVRRAFRIGQLDKEDVRNSYRDLGYDDDNAEILTEFAERERDDALRTAPAVADYRKGTISADELRTALQKRGGSAGVIAKILLTVGLELNIQENQRAVSAGVKTAVEGRKDIVAAGVPEEHVNRLIPLRPDVDAIAAALDDYEFDRITRADAADKLEEAGMRPAEAQNALDRIDRKQQRQMRQRCAAAIKERFLRLEINDGEADAQLRGIDWNPIARQAIIREWNCELGARGREASAAMLGDWWRRGVIDDGEYFKRLRAAGWSLKDSQRILQDSVERLLQQQTASSAAASAERGKQAQAAARTAAKEQAKQAAATKTESKAAEAARKVVERRDKSLVSSAESLRKKLGGTLVAALDFVKAVYAESRSEAGLSVDESLQAVKLLVGRVKKVAEQERPDGGVDPTDQLESLPGIWRALQDDLPGAADGQS